MAGSRALAGDIPLNWGSDTSSEESGSGGRQGDVCGFGAAVPRLLELPPLAPADGSPWYQVWRVRATPLVACHFQPFPVQVWLPGVPAGWSGLTTGLPHSASTHGHDSVFLPQASKLQGQELYFLFHLKSLQV